MSKTVGYVLLIGLLGSAIFSIGLLMWIWIRSSNPNETNKDATPTPRTSLIWSSQPTNVARVETSRYWLNDFATAGLTSDFDDADLACA